MMIQHCTYYQRLLRPSSKLPAQDTLHFRNLERCFVQYFANTLFPHFNVALPFNHGCIPFRSSALKIFVYQCNVRTKRFISSSVTRFLANLSLSVYISLNNFFQLNKCKYDDMYCLKAGLSLVLLFLVENFDKLH